MNFMQLIFGLVLLVASFTLLTSMPVSTQSPVVVSELTKIEREFAEGCFYGSHYIDNQTAFTTEEIEAQSKDRLICKALQAGLDDVSPSPAFDSLFQYGHHPDAPVHMHSLMAFYNESAKIYAHDKKFVDFCFAYHYNKNATKCWGWSWGPLVEMSEEVLSSLPSVNPRLKAVHAYIHQAVKLSEEGKFIHPNGNECRRRPRFLYDINEPSWVWMYDWDSMKPTPECVLKPLV